MLRFARQYAWAARQAAGAYGVPGLHQPSDFRVLADVAVRRVDALVADLERGVFRGEATVEALDDVSDTARVCSVVDVAELCRNTHTQREWTHAAEEACVRLHAVVADLNGRGGLYAALCAAQEACAKGTELPLSPEAAHVAASLRAEFERGGVHLSTEARDALQTAQAQVVSAGHALSRQLADPAGAHGLLDGVPVQRDVGVSSGPRRGRAVHAARESTVLRSGGDSAPLLTLLRARARIAQLLGYSSYAALATAPLFARTPEAPTRFCAQLAQALADPVRNELARMKQRDAGSAAASDSSGGAARSTLQGMASVVRASASSLSDARAASRFFSVNSTVDGLCAITRRLFGVTLQDEPLAPGEAWAPGVRKLRAFHAEEGPLGWVYLDLVPRPRKLPGAAHFVIRAGRVRGEGVAPRVALVANLGGGDAAEPGLPHAGVVLLHHEWGHALHSLLSRTAYQHLSGTRGAVDCVEAPSTLMERLAWSQEALDAWPATAGAHAHASRVPSQLLDRLRAARQACAASDALVQVVQSAGDLALHSARSPDHVDARFVASSLEAASAQYGAWPAGPGARAAAAAMHGLGHVVGYGAVYYSYLYGAALSSSAWRVLDLDADPLSPDAGQKLWRHLLRPGGTVPPAEALTALLGPHCLSSLAGDGRPDAPNVAHAVQDILGT